ncbi:MAG: bifunctional pyr operon transcriptional regulator/uracil phosphoribosyltransferase [Flavobacteriales bacterium]|nr:bifunctional pyr operon transcriptional regulator/uracil phosphoribosyltransferase [Flavobacteriales bacterium]|tara:strand:- start:129 stop:668 length:540 start_codon:yes stop_codon:yes gene_type:complete
MSNEKQIVDNREFSIMINRLSHQLIENHLDFTETVLVGLQPRGVDFARKILNNLVEISGNNNIVLGSLDISFFRDDFGRRETIISPDKLDMNFSIENKRVVLIDDVLFTGRSIRAALDALTSFGRPKEVELMVLIDRRLKRHLPIQPDYVGKSVDSISSERVIVKWGNDGHNKIILLKK